VIIIDERVSKKSKRLYFNLVHAKPDERENVNFKAYISNYK